MKLHMVELGGAAVLCLAAYLGYSIASSSPGLSLLNPAQARMRPSAMTRLIGMPFLLGE